MYFEFGFIAYWKDLISMLKRDRDITRGLNAGLCGTLVFKVDLQLYLTIRSVVTCYMTTVARV